MTRPIKKRVILARALVVISALGLLGHFYEIFGWDEAWLSLALVLGPIALAFASPRLCTRLDDADQQAKVRAAWWQLVPCLFAPWLLSMAVLQSHLHIPWYLITGVDPCDCGAIKDIANTHLSIYFLGIAAIGLAFLALWTSAPTLKHHGPLFVLAFATLLLTAFGSFVIACIIGLAIT